MRLDIDLPRSTIYLTRETGRLNTFSLNNGTITAEATELGSLIKLDNRWIYSAKNNDQFIF
ncbi:RHS repeat protein, partial [Pseudomonas aeruginosa]|nr:RHS repeat protein [Pseudomonas aeruginosa]